MRMPLLYIYYYIPSTNGSRQCFAFNRNTGRLLGDKGLQLVARSWQGNFTGGNFSLVPLSLKSISQIILYTPTQTHTVSTQSTPIRKSIWLWQTGFWGAF